MSPQCPLQRCPWDALQVPCFQSSLHSQQRLWIIGLHRETQIRCLCGQLISPQNFLRRHCPQFQGKRQKRLPLGACYKDPHCSTDSYKQPLTTVASQLLTGHRAFVPELWPGPLLTAIRLRLVSLSNNLLREHPPGPACGLLNYVWWTCAEWTQTIPQGPALLCLWNSAYFTSLE